MRITIAGVIINLVLAAIKGGAGIVGHSFALVADAVESSSDVITSLVVFLGIRISVKERDENHPYGHGKAEPIAAAIVAVTLIGAAVFIAINAVSNILTPHAPPAPFTLLVLGIVIVVKEFLFRYVVKEGDAARSTALKADAWHHRSDAITSAAAFIGILVAIYFGKGYESADDWASLVAALLILINAIRIIRPAIDEVMDTAPPAEIAEEVREVASKVEGVEALEKCYVRKMGFEFYVDLHVVVDGELSVRRGHDIAHQVKEAILQHNPQISDVLVHIEPADPSFPDTSS